MLRSEREDSYAQFQFDRVLTDPWGNLSRQGFEMGHKDHIFEGLIVHMLSHCTLLCFVYCLVEEHNGNVVARSHIVVFPAQ